MGFNLFKSPQEKRAAQRRELLARIGKVLTKIYEVLQLNGKQLDQAITLFKNNYPKEAEAKFVNLLRTLEELRHIEKNERDEERAVALDAFAQEQQVQITLLEHLEKAVRHIERGDVRYANEAHELLVRLRNEVKREADRISQAS